MLTVQQIAPIHQNATAVDVLKGAEKLHSKLPVTEHSPESIVTLAQQEQATEVVYYRKNGSSYRKLEGFLCTQGNPEPTPTQQPTAKMENLDSNSAVLALRVEMLKEKVDTLTERNRKLETDNEQLRDDNRKMREDISFKDREFEIRRMEDARSNEKSLEGVLEKMAGNEVFAPVLAGLMAKFAGLNDTEGTKQIEGATELKTDSQKQLVPEVDKFIRTLPDEALAKVYAVLVNINKNPENLNTFYELSKSETQP